MHRCTSMMWQSKCALCRQRDTPKHAGAGVLGQLLGPVGEDPDTGASLYVHRLCALWSPEVYQTEQGTLRCVMAAVRRGRAIRCEHCHKRGATIGCRIERCRLSFHLACAQAANCTFFPGQYMLACPTHAALFAHEKEHAKSFLHLQQPAGAGLPGSEQALPACALKTPTAGKRRRASDGPEEHIAFAKSAVKRYWQSARVAQPLSSDDEEHFQRKERQREARDKAKLHPVILGNDTQERAAPFDRKGSRVKPLSISNDVAAAGWDAVGGHAEAVRQLKEMVLLPLMYPDMFKQLGIQPPRGILFHGPPGTGKTLVARALAGACGRHSPVPVTFFARKGADCLGKFSGEAERTLRLLFDEASRRAPAIVFLDELDGLVPQRSARSGGCDQIYASLVSTLLALMDGITDRGAVVVIGATNRPEAIDQALRRPGRFDREVYFGLPSAADRAAILRVHTRQWPEPPSEALLQAVAAAADGFAGADLQALCTGAVMAAIQRQAPRLIDQLDEMTAQPAGEAAAAQQPEQLPDDGSRALRVLNPGTSAKALGEGSAHGLAYQLADRPQAAQPDEPGLQHGSTSGATLADSTVLQPPAGVHQPEQCSTPAATPGIHNLGPADPPEAPPAAGSQQDAKHRPHAAEPQHQAQWDVKVRACDWRAGLQRLPTPSARRQGLTAIAAEAARPVPHNQAPLLMPHLLRVLAALHASSLPLPAALFKAALAAATADSEGGTDAAAERKLTALGAISPPPSAGCSVLAPVPAQDQPAPSPKQGGRGMAGGWAGGQATFTPCRLLLTSAQKQHGAGQVVGAVLKLLEDVPVHTLSLPALLLEGAGDATAGCVQIVVEALRRASPACVTVFYLAQLQAWALTQQPAEAGSIDDVSLDSHAPVGSLQNPNARFESGRTAFCARTPGNVNLPASSPFRGLVSVEERGHANPSAVWTTKTSGWPQTPTAPGSARARHPTTPFSAARPPHPPGPASPLRSPLRPTRLPNLAPPSSPPPEQPAAQAPVFTIPQGPRDSLDAAPGGCSQQTPHRATLGAPGSTPWPGRRAAPSPVRCTQTPLVSVSASTAARSNPRGKEMTFPAPQQTVSEVWSVFEQMITQAPATQPILVLATCQGVDVGELPQQLLGFFTGPGRAVEGYGGLSQHDAAKEALQAACPVARGVFDLKAPSQEECLDALQRCANAIAQQVGAAAAASLQQRLAGQPVSLAGCAGVAQEAGVDSPGAGPQLNALPSHPPGMTGPGKWNEMELDQARRQHLQVLSFIRWCGGALWRDSRTRAARVNARQAPDCLSAHSMLEVARRAVHGEFSSLDAFRAAVQHTATAIRRAADGQAGPELIHMDGRQEAYGHHTAVAAASALQDELEVCCRLAAQQLRLEDRQRLCQAGAEQGKATLLQSSQSRADAVRAAASPGVFKDPGAGMPLPAALRAAQASGLERTGAQPAPADKRPAVAGGGVKQSTAAHQSSKGELFGEVQHSPSPELPNTGPYALKELLGETVEELAGIQEGLPGDLVSPLKTGTISNSKDMRGLLAGIPGEVSLQLQVPIRQMLQRACQGQGGALDVARLDQLQAHASVAGCSACSDAVHKLSHPSSDQQPGYICTAVWAHSAARTVACLAAAAIQQSVGDGV